jgi:hypothetical protein
LLLELLGGRAESKTIASNYTTTNQKLGRSNYMSLVIKIAIGIATITLLNPLAAMAETGATAAAVSIKFHNCCANSNGRFSITPGGNASGGGSGVSELSAAVATGETSATANSTSGVSGTTANAAGWSAPVNFSYESISLKRTEEQFEQSGSSVKNEQESTITLASKNEQNAHGNSNSSFVNATLKATATEKRTGTTLHKSTVNDTRTAYHYSGPSAGLRYLPGLTK